MPSAYTILLAGHVLAGSAALVLGPVSLYISRRPGFHPEAGTAYQWAIGGLTASAVGLAAWNVPGLWWLALLGGATAAAAWGGRVAGRQPGTRWRPWHLRLLGGSYVSLVTALLVVSVGSPLAWVLPTLIGSPLIELTASRAGRPSGMTPARPLPAR